MSSRDSLEIRRLQAKGVVGQVADDQPVAIRLRAINGTVVTSVTVTTATDITVITGAGTTVFDFATSTTIGELVDRINAAGEFSAKVLDALRIIPTANNLVNGAITISSDGFYDVLSDTSNANYLGWRMTYDRATPSEKPVANHRVEIKELTYNVTLGGSGTIMVYEVNGNIESLIYQKAAVSGVETIINWASGNGKISANDGNDLVIVIVDTVSITGSLTVAGYSV